ncbi:peroxide stress protein YaaA [Streptococcus ictaluri]|nr:peroxide stress protein YaaA [Streptococcus ictaluri]
MLTFLIPTAKEMKILTNYFPHHLSQKSKSILESILSLSNQELAKAYHIKEAAVPKEVERFDCMIKEKAKAYPAYQLFNGLMYRYIKDDTFSDASLEYFLKHAFITSSFYGIIPADAKIAEHRLDFQTKLKVEGQSLKNYWRSDYDAFAKEQSQLISLLSSEFEEVFSKESRQLWISMKFLEEKDGQLKSHSTISKKARGAFLTACANHLVEQLDDLKALQFNGFSYSEQMSSPSQYVYIKKEA